MKEETGRHKQALENAQQQSFLKICTSDLLGEDHIVVGHLQLWESWLKSSESGGKFMMKFSLLYYDWKGLFLLLVVPSGLGIAPGTYETAQVVSVISY